MFGGGVPKALDPPSDWTHIYIPIESYRCQDSEYINFNRFDTCRPKVMLPTPSWLRAGLFVIFHHTRQPAHEICDQHQAKKW